jgi:hypothetical protein
MLVCAGFAGAAVAQNAGGTLDRLGDLIRREAERKVVLEHGSGDVEIDLGRGRAVIAGPGIHLRLGQAVEVYCEDGLVVWGRVGAGSIRDLRALYAEGAVLLRLYGESFVCERAYLDLEQGRGSLTAAELRAAPPEGGGARQWVDREAGRLGTTSLLVRADRVDLSRGLTRLDASGALISTCTFAVPHWALRAERVTLDRRLPDDPDDEGGSGRVSGPSLEVLGARVAGLPWDLPWDTTWHRWLPRVEVGDTRRFGPYVRTAWPVYPGRALDVRLLADYLSDRGPAGGLEADWSGPVGDRRTFEGDLLAWAIRDRGEDVGIGGGARPLEPRAEQRARVALFHRDDMPYGVRREVELGWLSDARVLREYYEREAKEGREQVTAAYLRWRDTNRAATLLGRYRLNDFQSQVEHAPRLRLDWMSQPLAPWAVAPYLHLSYRTSYSRRNLAEGATAPDRLEAWVARADFDHRLDLPIALGPIQLVPYAGARLTGFSEVLDAGDGEETRTALRSGVSATTDIWRDYDVNAALTLRHVVTPGVGYEDVFYNDLRPDELIPIDELEQVREVGAVVLSLRNRIVALEADGTAPASAVQEPRERDRARLHPLFPRAGRGQRPAMGSHSRALAVGADARCGPVGARGVGPRAGLARAHERRAARAAPARAAAHRVVLLVPGRLRGGRWLCRRAVGAAVGLRGLQPVRLRDGAVRVQPLRRPEALPSLRVGGGGGRRLR